MDIPPVVHLIIGLVMGAISSSVAASKGRSAVGWFFGGFFLGIIGLIIVAVLPNLKEQERKRAQAGAERRRLREQLRQEKMKTDAFRQHAAGRLDSHDRVLGVDTRSAQALPGAAPRPVLESQPPVPPPQGEKAWYYESNGESKGPVPQSTLLWMLENGSVSATTLLWSEGQADWLPASQIPAFRNLGPA